MKVSAYPQRPDDPIGSNMTEVYNEIQVYNKSQRYRKKPCQIKKITTDCDSVALVKMFRSGKLQLP